MTSNGASLLLLFSLLVGVSVDNKGGAGFGEGGGDGALASLLPVSSGEGDGDDAISYRL